MVHVGEHSAGLSPTRGFRTALPPMSLETVGPLRGGSGEIQSKNAIETFDIKQYILIIIQYKNTIETFDINQYNSHKKCKRIVLRGYEAYGGRRPGGGRRRCRPVGKAGCCRRLGSSRSTAQGCGSN